MSPEILRNDKDYNESCDVYRYVIFILSLIITSFGITMYELIFETRPYSNIQAADAYNCSLFNLGFQVMNGQRPTIPNVELNPVEEKLVSLMTRCWDQDPEKRPS